MKQNKSRKIKKLWKNKNNIFLTSKYLKILHLGDLLIIKFPKEFLKKFISNKPKKLSPNKISKIQDKKLLNAMIQE